MRGIDLHLEHLHLLVQQLLFLRELLSESLILCQLFLQLETVLLRLLPRTPLLINLLSTLPDLGFQLLHLLRVTLRNMLLRLVHGCLDLKRQLLLSLCRRKLCKVIRVSEAANTG